MRFKTKSKRSAFLLGFAGILLVYSLYYLLVRDTNQFYLLPRKLRHVFKFLSIMYVYGIGTWVFSSFKHATWMLGVWHIVHLVLIGFLVLLGLIDWFFVPLSFAWKHLGGSAHEFLISPALYIIAGMVYNYFLLQPEKKQSGNSKG